MLPKFPWMKVCHDDFTTFLMALVMLLLATIPLQHLSTDTVFENHRKVSFNIDCRSYVYILSGQKLIKNAKNVNFGKFLKT